MADEDAVTVALTPVQLYVILNNKTISPSELAANSWRGMPFPKFSPLSSFPAPLGASPYPQKSGHSPNWDDAHTHFALHQSPGCATAFQSHPLSPQDRNRIGGVLQLAGGLMEMGGGALLILAPEPTMVTKIGGGALALHGIDTTQAAMRQLFGGGPVKTATQLSGTWVAKQAGASDRTADAIGVVLDVAVPLGVCVIEGATRIMAVRAGRVILSEEAVAGKVGRVTIDSIDGEGGHIAARHLGKTDLELEERALRIKSGVVSRFFSKELAEDAINDAIKANRSSIRQWAANAKPHATQEFDSSCRSIIGDGYVKAAGGMQQMSTVRVVFKSVVIGGKRIIIVTAYPIP
jgi:hypothetical protein